MLRLSQGLQRFNRNFSQTRIVLDKFANNTNEDSLQVNEDQLNNKLSGSLKSKSRQMKNVPFVKTLFCGRYEYDYLKFPEYDTNVKLDQIIDDSVKPLTNFLETIALSDRIVDKNGYFERDTVKGLADLGLFCQSLPKEFGGAELDATAVARVFEATGRVPSLGMSLVYNNEVAAKAILCYGSQEQKDKYLKMIASGQLRAGFCFSELNNGVDQANFYTIAKFNSNKKTYTLNGKKAWVSLFSNGDATNSDPTNSDSALVVLTKSVNSVGEDQDSESVSLNAFLVDSKTPGVKLSKQLSNFNGLNLYEVEFNDVELTESDLMGIDGSGHEIVSKINEGARYLVGSLCVGLLKELYKKTVEFVNNTRRFDKSISDFEMIKDRIADIETKLYTMESMTYMTAGIIDSYEIPDIGCETALTKIYCTETLKTCVDSCLSILAMGNYSNLNELETSYLSDLNYLSVMFNTNDYLRLYVATSGTILAGMEFGDDLVKLRNPFTNPGYTLKKMLANYKLSKAVNKKAPEYLYLWEHVHPSLADPVAILEQCTVKFMMTIKYSLLTHGRETVEVQYSLKHLANIAMHLYALNSVIARASRAYSIGLFNAQHEIGLVFLQATESERAITEAFNEIIKTRVGKGQENIKTTVAENVFKAKQHAASHSTSRNY